MNPARKVSDEQVFVLRNGRVPALRTKNIIRSELQSLLYNNIMEILNKDSKFSIFSRNFLTKIFSKMVNIKWNAGMWKISTCFRSFMA